MTNYGRNFEFRASTGITDTGDVDFTIVKEELAARGLLDKFGAPSQISIQRIVGTREPLWEIGSPDPVGYLDDTRSGFVVWVDGAEVCRVEDADLVALGVQRALSAALDRASHWCSTCGCPLSDGSGLCAPCAAAAISSLKAMLAELTTDTN